MNYDCELTAKMSSIILEALGVSTDICASEDADDDGWTFFDDIKSDSVGNIKILVKTIRRYYYGMYYGYAKLSNEADQPKLIFTKTKLSNCRWNFHTYNKIPILLYVYN